MAEPDHLRIRYREALIQAMQAIVRGNQTPSPQNIQQLVNELVQEKDKHRHICDISWMPLITVKKGM